MKKGIIIVLCVFLSSTAFSQLPILVKLNNGQDIFTNYAYITNSGSFLSGPFVRIDGKRGARYKISEVAYVQGRDQFGKERYFLPVYQSGFNIFAERLHHAERISIFYTDITNWSAGFGYTNRHYKYTLDDSELRKVNIRNLQYDLADNPISMDYIKKAKSTRTVQTILYAAGAGLLIHGFSSLIGDVDEPGPIGRTPSIPPTLIVGVIAVNVPWFLNNGKQNKLVDALKVYK
ncbi:MAG: hypothetical protein ACOCXH_16185 [Cyclobacteriaceae bacterium]